MNSNKLPKGIEIKQDPELDYGETIDINPSLKEFNRDKKYTHYSIYFEETKVGSASYRLIKYQNGLTIWRIDIFKIEDEADRRKRYGTHLFNYIRQKMWATNYVPIEINPVKVKGFYEFLTKVGFQERYHADSPNKPYFIFLCPENENQL